MRSRNRRTLVTLAAVVALGLVTSVLAGPETDQGGSSWPHQRNIQVDAETKPAMHWLKKIHDTAVASLPGASAQDKPKIVDVLAKVLECAAFDGTKPAGDPPPAHMAQHDMAVQKVKNAWMAVRGTPKDWDTCASELGHGH